MPPDAAQAGQHPAGAPAPATPPPAALVQAAKAALAAAFNLKGATDVVPLLSRPRDAQGNISRRTVRNNGRIQLGEGVSLAIPLWYDDLAALGWLPRWGVGRGGGFGWMRGAGG